MYVYLKANKRSIYLSIYICAIYMHAFAIAIWHVPRSDFPDQVQVWDALCTEFKQSWALSVFFHFFNNKKWFFAFFIKLIWLGVCFLNKTGAEIDY